MIQELPKINTVNDFDSYHKKYVFEIINDIKTNKNSIASFGQAQKPINVFLKVYVDWARRPTPKISEKIISFLHVPLDSIIMKTIKSVNERFYNKEIKPFIKIKQQEFSLSMIDEVIYYKWQTFFRKNHPKKPLLFDVIWGLNR